ncbi:MAG: tetratricopeptide repeat protein [Thermoplasmatota archaeon]
MEQHTIQFDPGLTGREEESEFLNSLIDDCKGGNGSTVLVSGEAGIGKTRLIEEALDESGSGCMNIIKGRCVEESLGPLSPVKEAFRSADLFHLVADNPPPKVLSAYLTDSAGILIAQAERDGTDLDGDIFTSMLKGVSNFVSDSLSMMGEGEKGGVSGISYKGYNILMETRGDISLILVIEGEENEFLIEDMHDVLDDVCDIAADMKTPEYGGDEINQEISWFIDSGKYEGKYLVDDSKLKRENLFDNILMGLRREASDHPIALFIDDLQWADPSTLSLLHYISRNIKEDHILLVGAYRPEDLMKKWDGEVHQLKSTLRNMKHEGLYTSIELSRLDKVDIINLLKDMLGEVELSAKFYDRAYKESEGNPFFLMEFVRHVIEDGHIVRNEDIWSLKTPLEQVEVPSRTYDLVENRLERVSEEQRKILEFGSVVGIRFESDAIEKGLEIQRRGLLEELSEIENVHGLIISTERGYRFDHKKIREALYENLNQELREEYHRSIAEYYEGLYEGDSEDILGKMIHHYYEAGDRRVISYLFKAGLSAQERYANEEAERFFTNALELIPEEDEEDMLYVHNKLGEISKLKGDYTSSLEHYQTALELEEDDEKKAKIYGEISELFANMGDYEKALGAIEAGAELGDKEMCDLLKTKGWVLLRKGDYEDAKKVFMKELSVAEERCDTGKLAQALHDTGSVYFRKGDLEKSLDHFDRAVERWENIDELKGLATSYNNIGIIYYYKNDFDEALKYHKKSMDIKEKVEDKRGVAISLNNIGAIYKNKGDFQSALRCYEGSLEILKKVGDKLGVATSLKNIGAIHYYQGDNEEALELLRKSLRMSEAIDDEQFILHIRCWLNEIFLAMGKTDLALEHGKKVLQTSKELGTPGEEGIARRVLGMVYRENGGYRIAESEFRRARDLLDETNNIMEFTKLLYEYALLFAKMGEDKKFEGHMKSALKNFRSMGMVWWAGKAEEALKTK